MIVTAIPCIEGKRITRDCGVVAGEAIFGANAVVGVDLDFDVLGQGNSMHMVSASGTAVVVE